MVHLALGVPVVEPAVLILPQQLVVSRQQRHRLLIDQVALNTMGAMGHLKVGNHGVVNETSIISSMHVLVGRLVEMADVRSDPGNSKTGVVSNEVFSRVLVALLIDGAVLVTIALVAMPEHPVIVVGS